MRTLHINLHSADPGYAELRYYFENPNQYQLRTLQLPEIQNLIQAAESDYYTYIPVDYAQTGQQLYHWLDGSDRWLSQALAQSREGTILAIAAKEKLAHLPWEVLHDGKDFLVERLHPTIVPVRWVTGQDDDGRIVASAEDKPANRALQVVFMACSPYNTSPVLDFEGEEGRILKATERQPLVLTVEESGCLSELGYLVKDYSQGDFDVLHLSGHANITDDGPRFWTETETGEAYPADAEKIAEALRFRLPSLLFLSGCRTGEAGKAGAVPSMAEQLLGFGAKAVLGWGRSVDDTAATEAAAALYDSLSAGDKLAQALAITYRKLIKNRVQDWHLLRLYVAGSMPDALVTVPRSRRGQVVPPRTVTSRFLDSADQVRVASRESFVGRRRPLQNCLRAIKSDQLGVLLYGMGGLGKSTLAARLCDRLTDFERVVLVGKIDEPKLVNALTKGLDHHRTAREMLQTLDEPLEIRLRQVFRQLMAEDTMNPVTTRGFLLVLDDFEANLEKRGSGFVLTASAAEILSALVTAIRETDAPHRVILTCRYDFESTQLRHFYKQPLDGLHGADLEKKCKRLDSFRAESPVDGTLQAQAKRLADGNPRLLEWLDKVLREAAINRVSEILDQLEANPAELREKVLAEALLEQIDPPMREMLQRGLVFLLPVPKAALTAVCGNLSNLDSHINRAIALGLLEVSPDESLRVPRILPLQLMAEAEELNHTAAQVLHQLWWEEAETSTEEQRVEIHRLALLGKEEKIAVEMTARLAARWKNQSRFQEVVQLCKFTLDIVENYRVFHQLARSEQALGEVEQALEHYQQALESYSAEDEQEKAAIIHNLATIYDQQGQVELALSLYQQSLELKERIGDLHGKAATLHQLAGIYAQQGQVELALSLYQQSLELHERIGDLQGKATTLHQLAGSYARQGQVELALSLYQQSLELHERIGNVQGKAATLHQLAGIYARQGQVKQALSLYQQSWELQARIGNVQGKAATLHQLAVIYTQQGQVELALPLYQQSLELHERIGDVQGKAATLHQLAGIYAQQGQVELALPLYQQSLELYERIGDVQGKAATLAMMGQLLADERGDFDTAVDYLQASLEILERLKSPDAQTVQKWLSQVLFKQFLQQSPEAQPLLQQLESADEQTKKKIFAQLRQLFLS